MATARDVVQRALRMLKVLDLEEDAPASYAERGLTVLNRMLSRWEADGIRLGYSSVAIGDTLLVPDENLDGIEANLAIECIPEFGGMVTEELKKVAADGYRAAQRDSFVVEPSQVDHMPGASGGFNINTGDY